MDAYKDRIAEIASQREEKELELSEVQEMCLWEPVNRADEQVAVRHADASSGDIRENPARRGQE